MGWMNPVLRHKICGFFWGVLTHPQVTRLHRHSQLPAVSSPIERTFTLISIATPSHTQLLGSGNSHEWKNLGIQLLRWNLDSCQFDLENPSS
jgi:hypothetical protein